MAKRRLFHEPIQAGDDASFFARRVDGDHYPFRWHSHPEVELALIVRGRGHRYVGDSMEPFVAGDFCLLGGDLPHTWYSDPADGKVSSRVIQFLPSAVMPLINAAPELRGVRRLLQRADRGLKICGATRDTAKKIMLDMFANPRWSWRNLCSLLAILGTLADSDECTPLASVVPPKSRGDKGDKPIDTIFSLLHRKPTEIPSQAAAARLVGMSPQSFSRFFHHTVGKTYASYVIAMRLMTACRELIETDRPITDIAFDSGFSTLSNFNRQFLIGKSMSPSRFRARYRQAESTTTDR